MEWSLHGTKLAVRIESVLISSLDMGSIDVKRKLFLNVWSLLVFFQIPRSFHDCQFNSENFGHSLDL